MHAKYRTRRLRIWAYLTVNLSASVIWTLTVGRRHPGLIKERVHPGPGNRESKAAFAFVIAMGGGHYLVAGLDAGRFHWSDTVPFKAQVAGLAAYAASMAFASWATWENPFFSSVVRIQTDRGHYVITGGPYRYVRHPRYLGAIVIMISSALALDSWLSMIPSLGCASALVRRTILEDKVLKQELDGYAEYAQKVRYRLVPGLW